ncbi:MAG: ATP-binding protein [Bacteroidales bacterium]|nr:ATP-binding protein [Bacteroidales bacterium]
MEKRSDKIKIAITGPESTGKTTLSSQLAIHFSGTHIPEYARDYILNLNRKYEYKDLEHITEKQIDSYIQADSSNSGMFFFDTWLIITKVWFQQVYGKCPLRILKAIQDYKIDLYLICAPDIEWVKDEVRENGGERRDELFAIYIKEVEQLKIPYIIIRGEGEARVNSAIHSLETFLRGEAIACQ